MTDTEHVWQRSWLTGTVTCERCHLLPLDDEDIESECSEEVTDDDWIGGGESD